MSDNNNPIEIAKQLLDTIVAIEEFEKIKSELKEKLKAVMKEEGVFKLTAEHFTVSRFKTSSPSRITKESCLKAGIGAELIKAATIPGTEYEDVRLYRKREDNPNFELTANPDL